MEKWYTEEIAKSHYTSPDMLGYILSFENQDGVSCFAANNPNCPPDAKIKWKKAIGKELTEEEQAIESTMNTMNTMNAEILEVF